MAQPNTTAITTSNKSENCSYEETTMSPTMSTYRLIIDVYLVGILCVAGWIGNALSVAVLRRDRRRSKQCTTNWLLQTLAIVDTAYLATSILIQPLKTIYQLGSDEGSGATSWFRRVYPYIEPRAWALASTAQTMTVWLVLLLTTDRYFAVCKPMKSEWRSLGRAKVAVFVVFIAACLYNIPRFFERIVVLVPICDGTDGLRPQAHLTSLHKNRNYFLVYKTVSYFIFRSVGPLVTLIVLNARLIVELRTVDRRRKALHCHSTGGVTASTSQSGPRKKTGSGKQHENLTAMLVGVVTVFIICQLPGLAIRVAYTASKFAAESSMAFHLDVIALRYANVASNALLVFNSAINIVVYCLVGKRFRRILLDEMLNCRCCSKSAKSSRKSAGTADTTM